MAQTSTLIGAGTGIKTIAAVHIQCRSGSFATDTFSACANQCPLWSESDQIADMPRMTLCARNGHPGGWDLPLDSESNAATRQFHLISETRAVAPRHRLDHCGPFLNDNNWDSLGARTETSMKNPHRQFLHLPTGAIALASMSHFGCAQIQPAWPMHSVVHFRAGAANPHR